ncbi:SPW repeat protein [uncultured Mucilaginibacter sp.]|uniref:SPW repeat domain-containing protein n=1 Tax=uncultured Mucilaginibacter sp. TaxID=797541 RepID=UPI0026242AAA|nr:SPW repeat protein [uncultured Mucilaginibacter sp.]
MRFISTKVHGMLDYIMGLIIIASPWLFGFADGTAAQWVPVVVGLVLLLSSLMTNYEYSIAKMISMPTHLGLDVLAGIFLIASPWLFGFAGRISTPHIVFGILEIGAGLMTKTTPGTRTSVAI